MIPGIDSGTGCRWRTGRSGRRRDPFGCRPCGAPTAVGSSGRGSRLRAHRRGGTAAAHLTARWHGQHVHSPSGTGPPGGERAELAGTALPRPSELTSSRCVITSCWTTAAQSGGRRCSCSSPAVAALRARNPYRQHSGGSTVAALVADSLAGKASAAGGLGGEAGRRANRDLDAICALFEIAARSEESGLRGVTGFLAEVEVNRFLRTRCASPSYAGQRSGC